VRDRGPGFDLSAIPPDRRGLRESVLGRMERHGGSAEIHTRPGEGTEVELVMSA
jgi:signal transduction histidine kinase